LQLPGRSNRLKEQPISDMSSLIPLLREAIGPLLDVPLVFFGHSNGALIAHEVARLLSRESVAELKHMVISSEEAPHARGGVPCRHQLGDDELLAELQSFGGTPATVLTHRDFMIQMLPAFRADFALAETHTFGGDEPLDVPASLWWGRDDRVVAWPEVDAWRKCFTEPPRVRVFDGGHFYFHDSRAAVMEALSEVLGSVVETDLARLLQASYLGL
jgi:medium-chain acyl-[acyl-carrier-protein] hydrolase